MVPLYVSTLTICMGSTHPSPPPLLPLLVPATLTECASQSSQTTVGEDGGCLSLQGVTKSTAFLDCFSTFPGLGLEQGVLGGFVPASY